MEPKVPFQGIEVPTWLPAAADRLEQWEQFVRSADSSVIEVPAKRATNRLAILVDDEDAGESPWWRSQMAWTRIEETRRNPRPLVQHRLVPDNQNENPC
jgi:hypothetical protein